MRRLISSQRYRCPEVVQEKSAAGDYVVHIVEVEVDGEVYAVVVDGHHSLGAAMQDGVEPELEVHHELQREADSDTDGFLLRHHHGDDYYWVDTGRGVW